MKTLVPLNSKILSLEAKLLILAGFPFSTSLKTLQGTGWKGVSTVVWAPSPILFPFLLFPLYFGRHIQESWGNKQEEYNESTTQFSLKTVVSHPWGYSWHCFTVSQHLIICSNTAGWPQTLSQGWLWISLPPKRWIYRHAPPGVM